MGDNEVRIAEDGEIQVRGRGVFHVALAENARLAGRNHRRRISRDRRPRVDGCRWVSNTRRTQDRGIQKCAGTVDFPSVDRVRASTVPGVEHAAVVRLDDDGMIGVLAVTHRRELDQDASARDALERRLTDAGRELPAAMQPIGFIVMREGFSPATGELTTNLKLRRGIIAQRLDSAGAWLQTSSEPRSSLQASRRFAICNGRTRLAAPLVDAGPGEFDIQAAEANAGADANGLGGAGRSVAFAGRGRRSDRARLSPQRVGMQPPGRARRNGRRSWLRFRSFRKLPGEARPDLKIVGFDLSEPMVQVGNRMLRESGLSERVELRVGDMTAFLPAMPEGTALVNSLFSLHHLPTLSHVDQCLAQLRAAVREHGCGFWIFDLARPRHRRTAIDYPYVFSPKAPPAFHEDSTNSLLAAYSHDELRGAIRQAFGDAANISRSRPLPLYQAFWHTPAIGHTIRNELFQPLSPVARLQYRALRAMLPGIPVR